MLEGLIGTWEPNNHDSQAIIQISLKSGKPHVVVFDKSDGEEFVVENIQYCDNWLTYEVFVPSNRYRTKHALRLKSKNRIQQKLTIIETWVPC